MLEALPLGDRLGPSYIIVPEDYDNDGDIDIVVVRDQLPAQIFTNDGKGAFSFFSEIIGTAGHGRSAKAFDVNLDGTLDLVIATRRGPDLLAIGNVDGSFRPAKPIHGIGKGSTGLDVADLDSDGDLDWLSHVVTAKKA